MENGLLVVPGEGTVSGDDGSWVPRTHEAFFEICITDTNAPFLQHAVDLATVL
jgi:hypothetical protein